MDKSNHTVTVPREYLEMLEAVYIKSKENKENISGAIKVSVHPSDPNRTPERILFLEENNVTKLRCERVIVVNGGRERFVYRLDYEITPD